MIAVLQLRGLASLDPETLTVAQTPYRTVSVDCRWRLR
jgi:hypothetical protein